MSKSNYAGRIGKIEGHIETINKEMGEIKTDVTTIKTNWNWMRYIIGINVTLWVAVIGLILKFMAG